MFGLLTDFVPLPFLSCSHFLELGVQNGIVPQIDVKDVGFVIVRFPVLVSFLLRQLTWGDFYRRRTTTSRTTARTIFTALVVQG